MTKKPKILHHRKLAFRIVDRGRPQGARAHWASIKSSTLVIVRYIKLTKNEYSMIDNYSILETLIQVTFHIA